VCPLSILFITDTDQKKKKKKKGKNIFGPSKSVGGRHAARHTERRKRRRRKRRKTNEFI
jgi:hypothetical protein